MTSPMWTSIRFFRYHSDKIAKGKVPRRFGYEEKMLMKGPLPRESFPDVPIKTMPEYLPKNAWNEKRALFGQNDCKLSHLYFLKTCSKLVPFYHRYRHSWTNKPHNNKGHPSNPVAL